MDKNENKDSTEACCTYKQTETVAKLEKVSMSRGPAISFDKEHNKDLEIEENINVNVNVNSPIDAKDRSGCQGFTSPFTPPNNASVRNDVGNVYNINRNMVQGLMDIALLSANANQLRFLLVYNQRSPTYYISLSLVVISLFLQVMVGVLIIFQVNINFCWTCFFLNCQYCMYCIDSFNNCSVIHRIVEANVSMN